MLIACKAVTIPGSLHGTYFSKGKDYEFSLTLLRDSIFNLKLVYQDARPACSGNWKYLTKDTILLECQENEDIIHTISSGYMNERKHVAIILNKNKLMYKNTILKKIK